MADMNPIIKTQTAGNAYPFRELFRWLCAATQHLLLPGAWHGGRWLLVLLVASVSALCYPTVNAAQRPTNGSGNSAQAVILVVGDSLSAEYGLKRGAGWVSLMEDRLLDNALQYRVVNASISGETTAGGRSRIGRLLDKHKPAVVILELGANDALRGLDLRSTRANLSLMTSAAREAGARVLLLGMQVPPNYGQAYTSQFSALFAEVAQAQQAALVPFWFEPIATDMSLFQADGIHPNENAQPVLLDALWPMLRPLL